MTGDGRLSLAIPAEMETIAVDNPQVEIALRARAGGFPTFNLISMAGRYDLERPEEALLEEVSRGYRGIGLTDTRVTASEIHVVDGVRVFHVILTYMGPGDVPFVASVRIVPSRDRHFVATFMDEAADYDESVSLETRIVESMSIEKVSADIDGTAAENPLGWPLMAGAALAFATLFLALKWRRRR